MEGVFNIGDQFESNQDDNIKIVDMMTEIVFDPKSGFAIIDNKEFESNREEAIKKLQDPKNQSWGILENEITAINQERIRLGRDFKEYYVSNVDENAHPTSNLSPQKIYYIIKQLMIRIKRLELVLEPDYSVIKYDEKRNSENYTQIKGYWINDAGKRVRSISRSLGKTASEEEELVLKILDLNTNKDTKVTLLGRGADIQVNDGNNIWYVETKSKNRPSLIRNFVMFENWKIYKKEYKLLE